MNKIILLLLLTGVLNSCVERYEFNVEQFEEGVVVEAFISDKSFAQTMNYPSDGRYFRVKLTKLNSVNNVKSIPIEGADVYLIDDKEVVLTYTPDESALGEYVLGDESFAADKNTMYKLVIALAEGDTIFSNWEAMPVASTAIEFISFEETEKDKYIWYKPGEKRLETFEGIQMKIRVPQNETNSLKYFRWSYEPLWIYIAPKAATNSPNKKCWVTSPYYLNNYHLVADEVGSYDNDLFFMSTKGNERVYTYFSTLVVQMQMSAQYYQFWLDLEKQRKKGGLYDSPPFNLLTNLYSSNPDLNINGYFGVVAEDAVRWTFDQTSLSYGIHNDIEELCNISYGPPLPGELTECEDCSQYTNGTAVNYPPLWW